MSISWKHYGGKNILKKNLLGQEGKELFRKTKNVHIETPI